MSKTAVVFSPVYYEHNPGRFHPESARRLRAIIEELKRSRLLEDGNCQFVEPKKASLEDVKLVHDTRYINHVRTLCESGGGVLDSGDTVASRESLEVALWAVGGTLKAVDLVMRKRFENTFALVRPPGHHASRLRASGFCIFNNVTIAAKYLLRRYSLKKVLILDIDAHHGNGTQEAFYDSDKILYISLHEDPTDFPGTGFIDEIGEGKGIGYNINIPLPFGTSDQIYLRAVSEIVAPAVHQYRPEIILVSAGFDGHYTDPVGNLSLSIGCYQRIYRTIVKLASATCQGRVVSVLEGGYSLKSIGKIAATAIAVMSGSHYDVKDKVPVNAKGVRIQGEKAIEEVKRTQKPYWRIK
jgi:acetoin utilization deacetylase AcuC-like enzyme